MKPRFLLSILSTLFSAGSLTADEPTDVQRMNVVMIAVDDLNDWVGFLGGHPQTKTPNMDRLAEQSMVFENAQCAAPVCNSSRTALMSGIAPYLSGIYGNRDEMRASPVLKDAIMMPQYFRHHGYTTMARGKIYHNAGMDPQSWDILSDHKNDLIHVPKKQQSDMRPPAHVRIDNSLMFTQKPHIVWKSTTEPKELTMDYQNALWAAQWLNGSADEKFSIPFFLACGIYRPHLPWIVPTEYYARFDLEKIELPPINDKDWDDIPGKGGPTTEYRNAVKRGLLREVVWAYLSNIAYADDCVGVILDALEKSPYRDNTIVVLWGDHGWHVGEKQRFKKNTPWEEVARTPFLVKGPGLDPGRSTRVVSLIDLYPTLLELAGLPAKKDLSGRSFVPVLKDANAEWNYPAITTVGGDVFSVRNERWRYILRKDGREELYDHSSDPNEWINVANNRIHDAIKNELRQIVPANTAR